MSINYEVQWLEATEQGLQLVHKYPIVHTPERILRRFKIISQFGKHYFCASFSSKGKFFERADHQVYEAGSGKKIIEFTNTDFDSTTFNINWTMNEVMRLSSKLSSYSDENKTKLIFEKLRGQHNISLKHQARVTCLKSFDGQYLKENLPRCLQQYLGINDKP